MKCDNSNLFGYYTMKVGYEAQQTYNKWKNTCYLTRLVGGNFQLKEKKREEIYGNSWYDFT
jgi:hypothetical protein